VRTLKVPFEIAPTGKVAHVEGEYAVLATYLRSLLMTRIGERVMRPTYGSRVQESLFEGLGPQLEAELDGDIRDAVRAWEPQIEIMGLRFETNDSTLGIELEFRSRSNLSDDSVTTLSVSIDRGGTVEET
jgi:uncharacterized protein